MKKLPDHLRLQEESPVLRVTCEVIDGKARKEKFVTTDTNLQADVMKALNAFGLRAITRKKLIDLLKGFTGRYGHARINDDQTNAYVGISVTPDPVIGVQIILGENESREMYLQNDLPERIGTLFEESRLPAGVREAVSALLACKDNFEQPVRFDRTSEKESIIVRIGYINSGAFAQEAPQKKKSRGPWRPPM
jgi:hypothetical protein